MTQMIMYSKKTTKKRVDIPHDSNCIFIKEFQSNRNAVETHGRESLQFGFNLKGLNSFQSCNIQSCNIQSCNNCSEAAYVHDTGLLLVLCILVIFCILFPMNSAIAKNAELIGIFLDGQSGIRLQMTQRIPGKVIMVDDKELLIALKNIRPVKGMNNRNRSSDIIRNIEVEELPGNVLAIVVTGKVPLKSIEHSWDKSGLNFMIKFNGNTVNEKSKSSSKRLSSSSKNKLNAKRTKTQTKSDKISKSGSGTKTSQEIIKSSQSIKESVSVVAEATTTASKATDLKSGTVNTEKGVPKKYGTRKNRLSDIAGDITDIVAVADLMSCSDKDLKKAYLLLKQSEWQNAFDLLNGYLEKGGTECLENVNFLTAYAFYQSMDQSDFQQLLKAESFFHNLLVNWSSSPLIPFAHASLALIYYKLDNIAVAEGHFTIVANEYKSYLGMPEVLYYLAMIYDEKGKNDREYNDRAIETYRNVFDNYSDSVYAVDAGVGLGKALFKKFNYIESRDILTSLVEGNPEIVYDSPEVLRSIGEAEYALHNSIPAREALTRVYNLFADIIDKDAIMTKVGDTYYYEKKMERAKAVYQFVMDKFPGTDGFLDSAMGLALCQTDRSKIEELYNMVKKDFGDHRLARVAMMRLAELYNKNGEYQKCIEEIENLLATHPTGLRYDAIKLMQSAYESLFKTKLKAGEYPDVLKIYEGAKMLLDRLESKEIFLSTGLAYLDAHIYEEAFNQLMESYKQYKQNERPLELLFGLGVAMDESGRKDDALNMLKSYIERAEASPQKVEAHFRTGNILFNKGELTKAGKSFRSAYELSKDRIEKGNILSREAQIYQKLNEWKKVTDLFEKAVKEYASATGKNYDLISGAYKSLGKSYLEQKLFIKAADAFNMALKISDTAGLNSVDIVFMLGDAYQKANAIEKAKEAFEKVAGTDDSIWARLAKERLTTLALAEKVSSS
ncbi:MAG: tetratricopeptide repeat protein [Desulfamplus sp.]|nr:tetratricopeptide repeat protein [Desulfamplus sp.]